MNSTKTENSLVTGDFGTSAKYRLPVEDALVAPERLDDDIEVPARPSLGLDDPRLESVPRLDESGIK